MGDSRLTSVKEWLTHHAIDFALITSGHSIFYLTAFHCHPLERFLGLFLFPTAPDLLVCPVLEESRVRKTGWAGEVIAYRDGEDPWMKIIPALQERSQQAPQKIAIEKEVLSFARGEALLNHYPHTTLVSIEPFLHRVRSKKTAPEVTQIKKAAQLADEAVALGVAALIEGCTEKEIVALIEYEMKKQGADGMAFDTMVLFGDKTGQPHGTPGHQSLKPGDLVLFDLGIVYQGYCSDITRTFAFASISEEQKAIYETVRYALEAALAQCQPGVPFHELDRAARRVIEAAGYGEYFTHRLGHGLGLEAHEYPSIHQQNRDVLEEGMVFTIEPGIYIPSLGGVRIEDDVVMTKAGYELLNQYPKELQIIPK